MGYAAGQLANGFQLLGLAQHGLGVQQLSGAFFDAMFQVGVERFKGRHRFAHFGMGLGPLYVRPASFGHFPDQCLLVVGPCPGYAVVNRHQRGQPATLDQWHADGGRNADGLKSRRLVSGQFAQVVVDHQGQAAAQAADRQAAEVMQVIVAHQAW